MIVWICGMSGSGKSTIGVEVAKLLRSEGIATVFVDGDRVRQMTQMTASSSAYDLASRRSNAEFVDRLVTWLDEQEVSVVVALQSIFQDILNRHHTNFLNYFEVHLDASIELLQSRDPKGLHASALSSGGSNVVGYGIPYARPLSSDLYIDMNTDRRSPVEMATHILARARERPST